MGNRFNKNSSTNGNDKDKVRESMDSAEEKLKETKNKAMEKG